MNIYIKSFAVGFLYVFGLAESPLSVQIQKLFFRDDSKSIARDWKNIGLDIHKAYDATEKPTS